eukprot:168430-Pleurochrysis_carterae.AAC.1
MLPLLDVMMRCDDGGGADGASDQRPSAASVAAFGVATAAAAAMALRAVRVAPDPGVPLHISNGRSGNS